MCTGLIVELNHSSQNDISNIIGFIHERLLKLLRQIASTKEISVYGHLFLKIFIFIFNHLNKKIFYQHNPNIITRSANERDTFVSRFKHFRRLISKCARNFSVVKNSKFTLG